jgi:hypothetical protein
MNLFEFFGTHEIINDDPHGRDEDNKEKEKALFLDVFEYMINNDNLHKKFFLPAAKKVQEGPTKQHSSKIWLPLVNKTCMEFYQKFNLKENPAELFNEEFRKNMCDKCAEYHQKHILTGEYNLGD